MLREGQVTVPTTAPAGYYPDPAGSGSQRWWDGQRWSEQLVAAATPVAATPFAPPDARTAPSTPATSTSPAAAVGVSVLASSEPVRRARLGPGSFAVIGLCLVVLVSVIVVWRARSDGSAVPTRVAGSAVVTPAEAAQVLTEFWSKHEDAVTARDVAGLRRLETGAASVFEPGAVACDCLHVSGPRQLLDTEFFVPKQTAYPAHFLVEAMHQTSGSPWTEILVFTKSGSDAAWLVAENSGFGPLPGQPAQLGKAVTDQQGYVLPPSAQQHERASRIAAQLASLWQQAKDTGRVPPQTTIATTGQTGSRLAQIAAFPQDGVQRNGLLGHARFFVDGSDPLVEFNDAGFDLTCQAVRETITYRPRPGTVLVQDSAQSNWGRLLAPGHYASVTNHGAWQTCFLISADPAAPVTVLNQDIDGGVPSGQ